MRTRLGLLAVAAGLLAVAPGPAQPRAATPAPVVAKTGFENLSFPDEGEARDARLRFEAVQDYLKERTGDAVPWDRVCDTAQFLLDAKSDYFYEPKDGAADADGRKRYVSIKDQTNRIIGAFPKEGRQFYQVTFGPTAAALLKDAAADGYDKAKLADVSQRYFHTQAGGQATLLLASLNLETGRYPEAAYGFDRLLGRPDSDDLLTPRTLLKASIAFKRAGDPRHAEAAAQAWVRLEMKFPRDGLAIGRRSYSLDDLKGEFARPVELMFGGPGDDVVAMRYGNPSHTGVGNGGTPFLDPAFPPFPMLWRRPEPLNSKGEADADASQVITAMAWTREQIESAYKLLNLSKGQVAIPGFFPVTAPNLVLFRTYDAVCAVVTTEGFHHGGQKYRAGELFWASPTKGGVVSLMDKTAGTDKQIPQTWWLQWQQQNKMPTLVFDNAQVGSLSHDGKLVYLVDDTAIPPPQQVFNPNVGGFVPPGGVGATPGAADTSRLLAIDLDTGLFRWGLGGPGIDAKPDDPDKTNGATKLFQDALFLGPPLPVNGLIYVMFEKDQQIQLACLNPHKAAGPAEGRVPLLAPELLWTQKLGSPNVRLGQEPLRRIQPTYLAYADGVLVCPTNCGAVVAVDVNARSLLWARGYSTPPAPNPIEGGMPGGFGGRPRRGGFVPPETQQTLSSDRWRAAAPIVAGGKVIVAAYDANQILCLDLRTGNLLWADNRKDDDLYVGGVIGDKVLVVGKHQVRAYELAGGRESKPKLGWSGLKIATPCGHGAATRDGTYYLPMVGDPDRKDLRDPQVWAVEASTGRVKAKTAFRRDDLGVDPNYGPDDLRRRLALGNLLFHEGMMVSQSASQVSAFPLIELKRREMDRLLAANPKDPTGLADRGELLLDEGKVVQAVADFREAERNDPPEAVRRRLRTKKHQAFTELLRADFAAGEQYLAEYEALCEIPIDTDEPSERQRQLDEQVRRKGLYLSLVARGREKQGRVADAFRAYRAFAALGDSRQLVSIPDEPNGTTRPDVWARGRIEAMVRAATDPAARRALAELVAKEWEAVRAANDLGRLKEFVAAFGPSFPEGRTAQLQLADKLLGTNNDDDARAAQLLLLQLKATADDRPTQARAVEALARLMTRRGLTDDAVGLYAQLGEGFADVPVRDDGATGADVYGQVVTDRRLLSHLEPGRAAFPGRYRFVEFQAPVPNRVTTFTLTPDGDLFPFFHRHRLTIEANVNGGSWVLKVADRVTGEERCRFPDLAPGPTAYAFGQGGPAYRLAQASGHTLLLTIGQWAYCFDLSAPGPDGKLGRKLWEYDLFKKNPLPQASQTQPPQGDPKNPDELVVNYEDGWTLRVGRSAVLQPTYVCLITRDGLAAVDPATGQDLWQRSNVSQKARVFGDARHIFLVEETDAGFKTRVLRASDGSQVEGAKDFSQQFTGPNRLAVLGRHLLLADGEPTAARVLRLYDPLTGADVWRKDYPEGSSVLKTLDPELTGGLLPDGTFEVLAARTGKVVFRGGLDKDRAAVHLRNVPADPKFGWVADPLLLADAERFYLFLNRKGDGVGGVAPTWIRSVPVNGVAYGFDRVTGKRLWFNEELFLKQTLLVERFDELPALVAAGPVADERTRVAAYRVAALDKQLGKVRHNKADPNNSPNPFHAMWTPDPRNPRVVELWRADYRLRIAPDDDGRVAGGP